MDNLKDNNINAAISTLVVSYLMKKFNLETVYYGMIYGLVIQLIMVISTYNYDFTFNWYYLFLLPILVIMSYIGYYLINYIKKYQDKDYISITLYDEEKIQLYMKYITTQKKYYDQSIDINYGDFETQLNLLNSRDYGINAISLFTADSKMISQGYNNQIKFKDLYLNIEGYYTWIKSTKEVTDLNKSVKTISVKCIIIKILKNQEMNTNDFFKKIENYFDTHEKIIELKYVKILKCLEGTDNHVVTFHSGVKASFEVLEEKFMKPFFHQDKDRLWSLIKNTCLNPEFYSSRGQNARVSILLAGPPGCGKSSIIYRIARCFSRHIISLDLRIASKANMYQILQRPVLKDFPNLSYKDIVYLFEEFDISITELALREKKYNEESHYKKLYESIQKEEVISDEAMKCKDYNEFCIRDLLEIFQGPIPFESSIMIATTNKYDEIKETCPELFRPGRLTPIYFGYIDQNTLQEISLFFFNKKIQGYLPDIMNIPTSQIIELVFEALDVSKESHTYFTSKLLKLMSQI